MVRDLEPGERDGGGDAELFGNPTTPVTKHGWPIDHPVAAAFLYCGLILLIAVRASVRRYRARTSD